MKLGRIGMPGQESPVVVQADGRAIDVSPLTTEFDADFFAGDGLSRLEEAVNAGRPAFPEVTLDGLRIGAPIPRPGKIVCIGLNYSDHAAEAGMPIPDEPIVFLKGSDTLVGPYDDVVIPRGSVKTDWEVELGVVIAHECHYLDSPDDAPDRIAGYVVCNDVSERAFQLERGGQWTKGKSCPTFNPCGPWLVTPDEVGEPFDLALHLQVNGQIRQAGSTSTMVFEVPFLIHYLSQFMRLEAGDLICTGTPAGVGMGADPPVYLRPGDVMELGITGLGSQRQVCVPAA